MSLPCLNPSVVSHYPHSEFQLSAWLPRPVHLGLSFPSSLPPSSLPSPLLAPLQFSLSSYSHLCSNFLISRQTSLCFLLLFLLLWGQFSLATRWFSSELPLIFQDIEEAPHFQWLHCLATSSFAHCTTAVTASPATVVSVFRVSHLTDGGSSRVGDCPVHLSTSSEPTAEQIPRKCCWIN